MYAENMEQIMNRLYADSAKIPWKYYYDSRDTVLTEAYPPIASRCGMQDIVVTARRLGNERQQPHRHEALVINCILQGSVAVELKGRRICLTQGDIFVAKPHTAYTCFCAERGDCAAMLTIFVSRGLVARACALIPDCSDISDFSASRESGNNERFILVNGRQNRDLRNTLLHLVREYVYQPPYYTQLVECALVTCLGLILRQQARLDEPAPENARIHDILEYMEQNCDSLTLQHAAGEFHYNPNYFSTMIRKETSRSFSELIRDFRLERACELLRSSELPVSRIAKLSGYSHTSNFYRCFKAKYGVSPTQLREAL